MNNKYFNNDDEKILEMAGFKLPETWWSRPYEYAFVTKFLKKNDVILDIGCGIEHPFKFYAKDKVKEVYCLDVDKRILDIEDDKIKFEVADMLDYKPKKKFDKIFIISVIEHDLNYLIEKFEKFKSWLTDNGRIIITADSPTILPLRLLHFAEKAGLEADGKVDYDRSDKAIFSQQYHLHCYSLVLKKKETKDNQE